MAIKEKFEKDGSTFNELAGTIPTTALKDSKTLSVNDSFSKGRYQDYILDTDKATDQTGAAQATQG